MMFSILKLICNKFLPPLFYNFLKKVYWNSKETAYHPRRFKKRIYAKRISAPVWKNMKISILCNVWNTPVDFLHQLVESVLSQNYRNWELLINNCSDCEHAYVDELLQKYALDARIKIFRTKNQGIANNSNFILTKACGEFVFLLDHDDILLPDTLEKLVAGQEKENSDFVYADEFVLQMDHMQLLKVPKKMFTMEALERDNFINHPALIRKSLLEQAGKFRDGFEGSQDHDLYLRVCEKTDKISYVPELLYVWRINEGSFSEKHLNICINSGIKAVQEHLKRMNIPGKVVADGNCARYKIIDESHQV